MEPTTEPKKVDPHFLSLLMMLASMAWQHLGKIPNPMTGKSECELQHAQISIDMVAMLRGKTKGNLTPDEEKFLDSTLADLQINYADEVEKARKAAEQKASAPAEKPKEEKPNDAKKEGVQ